MFGNSINSYFAENIQDEIEGNLSLGTNLPIISHHSGGAGPSLFFFSFIIIWIGNQYFILLLTQPFDPFSILFLLNLILSCLAAIQASDHYDEAKIVQNLKGCQRTNTIIKSI